MEEDMPADALLERISASLLELREDETLELTREAVAGGADPSSIIEEALAPAMTAIGERFEQGQFYLPELLIAADLFTQAIDIIKPLLARQSTGSKGTVVLGTVAGDIHEIGKNVVKIMLEVDGFEVHDLGIDVPGQAFVDKQRETGAEIIAASSLLTSTMPRLADLVELVKEHALRARVVIGGAPVRQEHAARYGADGYAPNAVGALRVVTDLVNEVRALQPA
jgi:methanogenic corrinoid protein MtbC1